MDQRKIRSDLILFTGSQLVYKLGGYVVLMLLTRYFEQEEMGRFFLAASLAMLTGMFAELGTTGYLTREVSAAPEQGQRHLSEVLSFQLPALAFTFTALNLAVWITKPDLVDVMILTSIYTVLEKVYMVLGAVFLGFQRVHYNVTAGVASTLLLVFSVALAVRHELSLHAILGCYIGAKACLLGIAWVLSRRLVPRVRIRWDGAATRRMLSASLSFFGVGILGLVHFNADTLMLGYMHTFVAVATYESAFKLLEASRFLIRPVYTVYFPVVSRLAGGGEWSEIRSFTYRLFGVTAVTGAILAALVGVTAQWIIPLVFGPQYSASVPVLRVLYICVAPLYTSLAGTLVANATGHERDSLRISAFAVALNIALNAFAIPIWGPVGAAWTTAISHTVLSLWLLRFNTRLLRARMAGGGPA